jgi:hypothetical protein
MIGTVERRCEMVVVAVMAPAREVVIAESALRILVPLAAAAVGAKKAAVEALVAKYKAVLAGGAK